VKHGRTDAERAKSAVSSEKLKYLTTIQVHLLKGSSNSGVRPNEKRFQREGPLILGKYTPVDKGTDTSFNLYKLSEDYNLALTKSELIKGPECRCLRRRVKQNDSRPQEG
jgi:hypothetical protein